MTPEEIRDLLIRTADSLERMETENVALRAILGFALPRPGESPLETQLNDLIRDADNGPIHQRYEELRRDIRQAAQDRRLQEMLLRFPPVGRPN